MAGRGECPLGVFWGRPPRGEDVYSETEKLQERWGQGEVTPGAEMATAKALG